MNGRVDEAKTITESAKVTVSIVQDIPQKLHAYFMKTFDDRLMANVISEQFKHCITEDGFEEEETIQEDLETIKESTILEHIMDQLAVSSMNTVLDDSTRKTVQSKIREVILQSIMANHSQPTAQRNVKTVKVSKRQFTEQQERALKMIEDRIMSVLMPLQKPKTNRRPNH